MKKISKKNIQKCKKIKILLSDVDGVLTDGGMYYSDKGEMLKKFNTKDGMGVEILSQYGIKTILITREKSNISKKRADKIKADIILGSKKKELELPEILKKYKVKPDQVAYIGDDINDLSIIKLVGFSATPIDGIELVKQTVDYVCQSKGGDAVLREVADLLLISKNSNIAKFS